MVKPSESQQIRDHFVLLVYPFFHIIAGKERGARLNKLGSRWQLWWNRLRREPVEDHSGSHTSTQGTNLERALDDTYFFLPYVRQLFFPEVALLPGGDPLKQVIALGRLMELPLKDLAEEFDPYGVIRLTFDEQQLEAFHPLEIKYRLEQGDTLEYFTAHLTIPWVDVLLMPQNIGFLVLKVGLDDEEITVDRLNDFLYHVRQVHKPTIDWKLLNWQHLDKKGGYEFTSRDLVDFLLTGFTETESDLSVEIRTLGNWLDEKDSVERYSFTERGQVYGQAFRLYTFGCFDDRPLAGAISTPLPTASSSSPGDGDSGQFVSLVEKALYELATCTKTADPNQDYLPHSVGLKQIMDNSRIALWANWEAIALHDNVVFLATRPTAFTRINLPHNVESDYFHLYLLNLYQKIRLSVLSGELMRRGDDLYENLHEARELWDSFTMFRNHYWFAEVTFKPQGTELYKKFQRGLNALALYEAVSNEVSELQQYYERKADQDISEAARKLQEGMAKNVEITRGLQESTNEAVLAAKDIANRQLILTGVMTENLKATKDLQADMTRQLRIGANIQIKVEWIEILVVGFYTAELAHIIISLFEREYHFELWWSTALVLASGLISALITWAMLRPPRHESD